MYSFKLTTSVKSSSDVMLPAIIKDEGQAVELLSQDPVASPNNLAIQRAYDVVIIVCLKESQVFDQFFLFPSSPIQNGFGPFNSVVRSVCTPSWLGCCHFYSGSVESAGGSVALG
jgi:hypothetical protein